MLNIKNRIHITWRQALALIALGFLVVISHLGHTPAQTVIQGYDTDTTLQHGMIIAISQKDATKVEAATSSSVERMRGVVVDPADAAVTLSSPSQKVFVAGAGRYSVLVSNQNGSIHADDYISISSLPGIGMKARGDQSIVLGRAITAFDGTNHVISTASVIDKSTKQVAIGTVTVDINIIRNPLVGTGNSSLPSFLQSASTTIAGKDVSPGKVYLAAVILLMAGIISGSMLYAGVRSSIVSIGRNPLSKRSIIGSLLQVVITSLIIFIGGLFGVYLLLKL